MHGTNPYYIQDGSIYTQDRYILYTGWIYSILYTQNVLIPQINIQNEKYGKLFYFLGIVIQQNALYKFFRLQLFRGQIIMYTINTPRINSQKCESCLNSFIQYVGTQAWCLNCKKAIKTIEQQIKVVPKMYQSNCKQRQSSAQIKITSYLSQFANKFGGIIDNEQMQYLFSQAMTLKNKKGITTKNYRQNAAVIVYIHFKDVHKLSIKQFCKKNQIEQKSFNKSYLVYQKLIKQNYTSKSLKGHSGNQKQIKRQDDFKIQYTEEVDSVNQSLQHFKQLHSCQDLFKHDQRQGYLGELKMPQNQHAKIQHPQSAIFSGSVNHGQDINTTIQKIMLNNDNMKRQIVIFVKAVFNQFFVSTVYRQKRETLSKQLSDRILQIYRNVKMMLGSSSYQHGLILQRVLNDQNFYRYLFYLVLKRISHGISQFKYRKIIHTITGEIIKSALLKDIVRVLQASEETLSFSGDSVFLLENSGTTGSQFVKMEEKQ